eukprot:15459946-Alexandrium_andersonii.AAC.1
MVEGTHAAGTVTCVDSSASSNMNCGSEVVMHSGEGHRQPQMAEQQQGLRVDDRLIEGSAHRLMRLPYTIPRSPVGLKVDDTLIEGASIASRMLHPHMLIMPLHTRAHAESVNSAQHDRTHVHERNDAQCEQQRREDGNQPDAISPAPQNFGDLSEHIS